MNPLNIAIIIKVIHKSVLKTEIDSIIKCHNPFKRVIHKLLSLKETTDISMKNGIAAATIRPGMRNLSSSLFGAIETEKAMDKKMKIPGGML